MSVTAVMKLETFRLWGPLLLLASLAAALLFAPPASGADPTSVNSCVGYCGGISSGSCWCDSACSKFGDCCSNFDKVCHDPKPKPKHCGGYGGFECKHHEFCEFPKGTCHIYDNAGTCTEKCDSHACPKVHDPVCGCDGHTYSNACEAKCAQVSIDHHGKCGKFCPGGGGSSDMAKAWIRWRKSSPDPVLDCPDCDQFNSSGGAVFLESNSSNKHFEFVFEDLGWKFECDCSSHKGPLARPTGPRGTLQVTLADDPPSKSHSKSKPPGSTVCSARFAQPTECLPGGASEDLHVRVDCSESVKGFHLLFLR